MKRKKHLLWVVPWIFILTPTQQLENSTTDNFKPRMDYDQWKPLGRGDPLKHDPTYDYVPPVLDRVHYWIDPVTQKTDKDEINKSEVLLLGVSSKKSVVPSIESRKDTYDSFIQFMDNSKYYQRPHQRISNIPHFPPFMKNKSQYSRGSEQRIPYTMLMPPPLITKPPINNPSTSKTPITTMIPDKNQVTIQESKIIYQSSGLGGLNSSSKLYKDDLLLQKLQPPESYMQIQFAAINNNNNKTLIPSNSDINYVTAPPLITPEIMHKGQVSDDNLDITNTYVKIGKTEAQVQPTSPGDTNPNPELLIERPPDMMIFSHIKHPISQQTPLTLQTIQSMQTLQPPQITKSPSFPGESSSTATPSQQFKENPIVAALKRESTTIFATTATTKIVPPSTPPPTTTDTSLTTDPLFKHYKQPSEPVKGPLYLIIQGHSKVKTYGPSRRTHNQILNELKHENNKRRDGRSQDLDEIAKLEEFFHGDKSEMMEDVKDEMLREGKSGNLQTLKHVIETRLGAINSKDFLGNDVKETELHYGYTIDENQEFATEKYYKGYVAEGRQLPINN